MTDKTVLIVDDDAELRRVWRMMLERFDFEVTEAENGEEGLAQVREQTPDVLIVDYHMPVMDGYAMMQHVQALETQPKHKIFISGTHGRDRQSAQQMRECVDLIVGKPVGGLMLAQLVQRLVKMPTIQRTA